MHTLSFYSIPPSLAMPGMEISPFRPQSTFITAKNLPIFVIVAQSILLIVANQEMFLDDMENYCGFRIYCI